MVQIQNINPLEFNGKIFQIFWKTVISRFLGLFDHMENVLEISEECLPHIPCSNPGTNENLNFLVKISEK